MRAAKSEIEDFDDEVVLGGAPVVPTVLPGQTDPHAVHYFYSAGERVLSTRSRDVGYSSIPPGYLVPLRPFKIRIPNDTVESLYDANAPKELDMTVEPRDQADALMTRYQHRGGRILFPLTGMEGKDGLLRAKLLFTAVVPNLKCSHKPEELKRMASAKPVTCVFCRLEDLRSESSIDRIEQANLSEKETIPYGLEGDGSLRTISEVEAATIIHQLVLSANEEMLEHMMDTLQVSAADVEAGKVGPGKKKFDKRDDWYFLNTHTAPAQIAALEAARASSEVMASSVNGLIKTIGAGQAPAVDVAAILAKQEAKHKQEMADFKKEVLATIKKVA